MITQKRVATGMKSTARHVSLQGILSLISKRLPSCHVKNSAYEISVKLQKLIYIFFYKTCSLSLVVCSSE